MPTPGPVKRGRSSIQTGEGTTRRGRVRRDQSADLDRLAALEADNAAQQAQLENQAASISSLVAALGALEEATVAQLRPQAVVCHHAGVTRAFVRRPGERWEPQRLGEVLARASLRG